MGASLELGRFISELTFDKIPAESIATQKKSIIDCIGNILGASGLGDGCGEFVELAKNMSGYPCLPEATVIGFNGLKLPAAWAAFANGAMAQALDFGDSTRDGGHPNNSSFSAALAVSEKLGNISGKQFLTALIAGSETFSRISDACRKLPGPLGFYPPVIFGSYSAVAAVSSLLGLDPVQIVNAFSFNLCQTTCSSELMNNSDTVIRSIRECFAAKNAVISGYAAKTGLKGFEAPLEGKLGFFHAYAQDDYDQESITRGLGTEFRNSQLVFKPWPSCLGTNTAIKTALLLKKENDIDFRDIRHIHVKVSKPNNMLVEPDDIKKAPASGSIAKFSIQYTIATALVKGNVTIDDFSHSALKDPDVLALARKITHETMEEWQRPQIMYTELSIETSKGTFTKFMDIPYGHPDDPMSYEQLCGKMRATSSAAKTPPSDRTLSEIQYSVEHLDEIENISRLTALL